MYVLYIEIQEKKKQQMILQKKKRNILNEKLL